ncbi:MAG: hypothetical protein Fur009_8390 [Candidatus Microgenomates bacterium]
MKIGFLLPSIFSSNKYSIGRIFAPKDIAIELVNKLVDKNHLVYFYTSKDLKTKAINISGNEDLIEKRLFYYQFRYRDLMEQKYTTFEIIKRDYENYLTLKAYKHALEKKLDIIHSFHDFSAHYFNELTNFPTVYTLHDPLPQQTNTIEYLRFKNFSHHNYISISKNQQKSVIKLNFIKTIYHGINISIFDYNEKSKNHIIYFGRIIEDKGPDIALKIALKLNIKLKFATSNIKANLSQLYFDNKIKPFIDNKNVFLEGFIEGKKKSQFINEGKLFLFPIQWEEPFGLVMIESMACGTPVVAFARGSVPEVIKDGETGFIVNPSDDDIRGNWIVKKTGIEGLCEAVERIYSMPEEKYRQMRRACRAHVEKHFTIERMVNEYEKVYEEILSKKK